MRIVSYILKFTVVVAVVSVLGFLVAREALLYWGTTTLKRSLVTLKDAYIKSAHTQECLRRGGEVIGGEALVNYQLRFLSSTEYVLEAVCTQFSLSPIVFERASLPPYITKVPGTSGFIWGELRRSGIELAVFDSIAHDISESLLTDASFLVRTRKILVDDRVIVVTNNEVEVPDGPVTSCEGYGFQCCQTTTQVGLGAQITGLSDCHESCYATCSKRPSILSFTSNPFFDAKTRTLEVEDGSIVEFLYVSDAKTGETIKATLDFGDGIQGQLDGGQGSSQHAYSCGSARCTYTALLKLSDQWGVDSASTPLSQITVIVTR